MLLLVGVVRSGATMLGDGTSDEEVMKIWNMDSSSNVVSAADLQQADHPANEWMIKLKTSFAGVLESVCEWERKGDLKLKKSSLLSSVSGSVRASGVQAAELQTFVHDYEMFRSSSGDQICSHSKQFLRGLDVVTVGTTNVTALKEFQYSMGQFVSYTERNMPVKVMQSNAGLWGLDRIDQPDLPYDNNFLPQGNGSGVHVYILDTGINSNHTEFTGRIGNGYDFVDNDDDPEDCHGHGTHCAGTALGSTYGVARAATLHGVRVLNCGGGGSYSGIINALNWVAENHVSPAVASMSLGGGFSQALNDAVGILHDAGVVVAVAAGNSNTDACRVSPASAPKAFTVASSTSTDYRSSFSNYGPCTNLFAPGSSIKSAWIGGPTASRTISGTSMATPHVAGAMAVYLGINPAAQPDNVWAVLSSVAASDKIRNVPAETPNFMLQAVGFCDPTVTPGPHVDCVLSEWSEWSECTIPTGSCTGVRTRLRTVLVEATGCGMCTADRMETQECFDENCVTPEPTQHMSASTAPLTMTSILLAPDVTDSNMSVVCQETFAGAFPVDPTGHTVLPLGDDESLFIFFPSGEHFTFFGTVYQSMYVGSNGYITFGQGDTGHSTNPDVFFAKPRIAALMMDLNPTGEGSSVKLGFLEGRAVVTWVDVPYWGTSARVNLQIELIFGSDEVRISYGATDNIGREKFAGVSDGDGTPPTYLPQNRLIDAETEVCAAPPTAAPPPPAPPMEPPTPAPPPPVDAPTGDGSPPPESVRDLMVDWLEVGLELFGEEPPADDAQEAPADAAHASKPASSRKLLGL